MDILINLSRFTQAKNLKDSVEKRLILILLPFKGDHLSNRISQHLRCAPKRTYFSVKLNILHTILGLKLKRKSTNVPELNIAPVIYQFTCNCSDTCLGRTDRCFGQRMGEHVSKWSVKQMILSGFASQFGRGGYHSADDY